MINALSYLQEHQVAHRDIKPANILIFPGEVYKLTDFGISIANLNSHSMITSEFAGSQPYLSPKLEEYLQNKNLKLRHNIYKSDVFSLGLTLLEVVTLTSVEGLSTNK